MNIRQLLLACPVLLAFTSCTSGEVAEEGSPYTPINIKNEAKTISLPAESQLPDDGIVNKIEEFFETEDLEQRRNIAGQIQADPLYTPAKMNEWLHRARLFEGLSPGYLQMTIPVDNNQTKSVTLRIPQGYDATKAYPLLIAIHPSGGSGPSFMGFAEQFLGSRVNEFIIAAPTGSRQINIDAPGPETQQNPMIWTAIRKKVHVDSDRIHLMGFSNGGYASWTWATVHTDWFASAIPYGGCQAPVEYPKFLELMFKSTRLVPIMNAYGENDTLQVYGISGPPTSMGTVADLNRKFKPLYYDPLQLNIKNVEQPGAGHTCFVLTNAQRDEILSYERPRYPKAVQHWARYLYQAQGYWVEGRSWQGDQWTQLYPVLPSKSLSRAAMDTALVNSMAMIDAKATGNDLTVNTTHLSSMIVWLGDELISWDASVKLNVNGQIAFEGRPVRDLYTCLSEATRTFDFERLRWMGIDVNGTVGKPLD